MHVQNALGVGLYEKPFKVCLAHALRKKGHQVLAEVKLDIQFDGLLGPDSYQLDLLVPRHPSVDTLEELQPFLGPVLGHPVPNHRSASGFS
jgi:GxxExxY protein